MDLLRRAHPRAALRINPYLLLLFGLSLFALTPLLSPGYFYDAHDGRHSVFYLLEFHQAFRDGAWWPRWGMDHAQGYGYPVFLLQAPLAFYTGELFILLGASVTLAAKLTWVTGFLLSGWGMHRLVTFWLAGQEPQGQQRATVQLAGVAAGLLYVYAPYHLLDIYVRGALAEFFMLSWFPWVFWAFDRLIREGAAPGWPGRLVTATLLYAAVILTHTFALLSFTPLLMGFILFRLGQKFWQEGGRGRISALLQRTGLAAAAGVLTLLLAAIFILPLLAEGPLLDQSQWTRDTYNFRGHFVFLGQFFDPFWGFGYSDDPTGANDGMSFQVGAMLLFLGMVGGYLLLRRRLREPVAWFLLLSSGAVLFSMTPWARPLWEAVTILQVIQFPWRLLALVIFLLSGLGGLAVWHLLPPFQPLREREGLLLVSLLAVFASVPYVQAELQPVEAWRNDARLLMDFEWEHPTMIGYTGQVKERFTESLLTEDYRAEDFPETGFLERLAVIQGKGEVLSQTSRGASFQGLVQAEEPVVLQLRAYHFPGWQVTVDGVPVTPRVSDPHGLMEIDLPPGQHRVEVRMGATPARRLGLTISGFTALFLLGLWFWGRSRHSA